MNGDTVRIRFVTQVPEYRLPASDFEVSSALNRKGLSDALNQVFELDPPIPFDFKISGNFLRMSLSQAIKQYKISTEKSVIIEFFPAFRPPTPDEDQQTEAWISCIKIYNDKVFYSLYDGSVHVDDAVYKARDEATPIKTFAKLGNNSLVCGDIQGHVVIFDMKDPSTSKEFALHNGPIHAIATHPTLSHLFISGGSDSQLSMWSTSEEAGQLLSPFVGHTDSIQSVEWVGPSKLVSGSLDRTIRTWDVNTQQEMSVFSASCGILSLACRGDLIVTGHPDRSIRLWDTRESERRSVVREFKLHTNWVTTLAWHNDEVFASGSHDGSVKLWNCGTEIPLFTVFQHDEKILGLTATDKVLVGGGTGQSLHRFNFHTD